jgi:hypothetical protein
MTTLNAPALVARSKPKRWPLYVLVAAFILLAYMTREMLRLQSLDDTNLPAILKLAGVNVAAVFFGVSALVCAAAIVITVWRGMRPREDLVIDQNGVASNLFWGRGYLPWNGMTHAAARHNWLFLYGTDPDGRPRKLTVNLEGLDRAPQDILKAIHDRRPDLMDRTQ